MAQYLVDTHVLIWLTQEPNNLSSVAQQVINSDNILLLSYASVWEIVIKLKSGKLVLELPVEEFIDTAIRKHELTLFPVSLKHIYQIQELPLHHRDPFDRMLIAQALSDSIPFISSDSIFRTYPIECVW